MSTLRPRAALAVAVVLALAPSCIIRPAPPATVTPAPPPTVTITVIGTNDLHGRLAADGDRGGVDVFAGYLANLRAARARDGGRVILVDAGDAFQGTLESNLGEGAAVIAAYNALGYDAMAIGNHEFDFGPAGEASVARAPTEDPQGAIKARAVEARFPILAANTIDVATGRPVAWPNVRPTTMVEAGGIRVGVIGLTTEETPSVTLPAHVVGLRFAPLVETVTREAAALRAAGARVVVVVAHAGARCQEARDPRDPSSCDEGEIVRLARALPPGTVDAMVGGHTHHQVAHVVNGVPIIESWSYGRAFGRIDLVVDRASGRIQRAQVHPPQDVCARVVAGTASCVGEGAREPAHYEGAPVVAEARVARAIVPWVARAQERRDQPLGVVATPVPRAYDVESPLGNLFVDLLLASVPGADAAITNGGGLRADLPAGELTYGAMYAAFPFDNRLATLRLRARQLAALVAHNLEGRKGFLSLGGLRARAVCRGGALRVTLIGRNGRPVPPGRRLTVVTTEFLATGGDGLLERMKISDDAIRIDDALAREAMVAQLRRREQPLRGEALVDPGRPRVVYPGKRPVRCAAP